MYFRLFLIALFYAMVPYGMAQKVQVHGYLQNTKGDVLPYVDLILYSLPDTQQVANVLTDERGYYAFDSVASGKDYQLMAYMIDYGLKSSKIISIPVGGVDFTQDLQVEIVEAVGEDVKIVAKKPTIQLESDKMVMSVENSLAAAGLTGVDILRRVPGVSVDKDGRISVKGKNGVLVLLDDKALYMTEDQLGNFLRSIPSSLIKEIEVVTSPSAKYDAVGNAGVINIKLKKGAYEGLNGTVNLSAGTGVYYKSSFGTTANYKKQKLSLDFGYDYNNRQNLSNYFVNRYYKSADNPFGNYNTRGIFKEPQHNHTAILKGKYQLGEKTSIGMDFNGVFGKFNWNGGAKSFLFYKNETLQSYYDSRDYGYFRQSTLNGSLDLEHSFDTLGTKLLAVLNYNAGFGFTDKTFNIQYFDSLGQNLQRPFVFLMTNHNWSEFLSGKMDFTQSIKKKYKWESGLKLNHLSRGEPVNIQIAENGNARDASNHFTYTEQIASVYTMISSKIGRFKWQAGLRAENTSIRGTQTLIDSTFGRDYLNLFPSANLSYSYSEKSTYTMLYSRRIVRPSGEQLNPVLNMVDPFTAWGGYPYLMPEYTDNVELSYAAFGGYLVTTLNYSYTKDPLNWVNTNQTDSVRTISGFRNLNYRTNKGISLAVNMPIAKWWQSSNYVYVFANALSGDIGQGDILNRSVSFNANMTQTFTLPKNFNLEASGNYESAGVYGVGRGGSFWQLSLALQKSLYHDKLSFKVTLSDMFWKYYYRNNSDYGGVVTKGGYRWDNRVLMFTLSYKFGKRLNFNP